MNEVLLVIIEAITIMARWLSWLERRPVTAEVVGSNPIRVACESKIIYGILAQLGEHLPYKQRVTGSSPVGPIHAGVAELADAQDLKSCGTNLPYRFDSGRRHYSKSLKLKGFRLFFVCLKMDKNSRWTQWKNPTITFTLEEERL